jgi:hypothetical protein
LLLQRLLLLRRFAAPDADARPAQAKTREISGMDRGKMDHSKMSDCRCKECAEGKWECSMPKEAGTASLNQGHNGH